MATPPRVTRTEVDAALDRIVWRHDKVEHPRRSGLSDDPAEVVEHLTRHSATLPQWVVMQDTLDALVLTTWLWWEDRRRERALLRRGLYVGLTHRELGTPLGITTRQGLRDRLDRLDALLAHDHPDEKLTRTARRDAALDDPRRRWIAAHAGHIHAVLTRLLAQLDRVTALGTLGATTAVAVSGSPDTTAVDPIVEAGEWLVELRADLAEGTLSPATLSLVGLVLAPLRIAARDAGLPHGHGLWRAIREASELRVAQNLATAASPRL